MSSIKLESNASGTGIFTIASPNSNTNRTLTLPDATGTFLTNSGTEAGAFSTLSVNSNNISAENSLGFRNRIINGDMRIAQRGTSAVTTTNSYAVDRFRLAFSMDGACSLQQDSSAPTGFVNSIKFTTTTADASLSASQYVFVQQNIEGTNVADLAWGSASAKTVTLSFWVRSSLTGTFGGALENSGDNRSYPFTYSISAANTWEQKSVTIAGDTSGTWLTTTGVGIKVYFGLGVGSTFSGTAGAWAGADYFSATGATSVIGTLNATWYVTGVQLEVGNVATPFERRPYGTELALCQRYFQIFKGDGDFMSRVSVGQAWSTTNTANHNVSFIVTMRGAPTLTQSGLGLYSPNLGGKTATIALGASANENGATLTTNSSTGLTGGNMWYIAGTNTSSFAAFSSEL